MTPQPPISARSGNPFQDLCTMLGAMTVVWAWAENTLAMTIGVIIENHAPLQGDTEPPVSLKRRIAFLKTALRDVPALEPLKEEGHALCVRFRQLGVRRNALVHGAAWQLQEGGFQSLGLRAVAGNYAAEHHRFKESDAVLLSAEITKLQDDAGTFLLKAVGVFE